MDVVKDPDNHSRMTDMVNQYQGMLLHMCYFYLHEEDLARDAVQDTFLKAYRSLDSFRGECSEKTWLTQIAINTCKSIRRSAWMRYFDRRVTPEEMPESFVMPESEESDIMYDIMELPSKLKEVLLLYYWQDMSVSEISQILGIAQSSVSRRLKQARDKLHAVLDRRYQYGRSQR